MAITQTLHLDVAKQNIIPPVWIKAGDQNSRYLNAAILDCGIPYSIPENAYVYFNITRPDGLKNQQAATRISDDTISVLLSPWCAEISGIGYGSLSIIVDNEILTTFSFEINIEGFSSNYFGSNIYQIVSTTLLHGTYYILVHNQPYSFTTTSTVPINSVLAFNESYTSLTIYQNTTLTGIIESGIPVYSVINGEFISANDLFRPIPIGYYNTVDATVTAEDITEGKIAYGQIGKLVGTSQLMAPYWGTW